jgi:hypothetical protein
VGVGNVEALPPPGRPRTPQQEAVAADVEAFYRSIGTRASANGTPNTFALAEPGSSRGAAGTSISVTSIRGDDCCMENLGLLADLTAGKGTIRDPVCSKVIRSRIIAKYSLR